MQDLSNFFNQTSIDQLDWGDTEKKEQVLYSPKYSDGKNNVYSAIIRFVLHPNHPTRPYIHKYTYWLEDETLGIRGYYDSPQTIKGKCPIYTKYWEYRKSGNAVLENIAEEKLSRKEQFVSLVQIVKDPNNPHLEGKLMVYRFPPTIKNLIDAERNGAEDDLGIKQERVNVYDFFNGKDFKLVINKKGTWPDYSKSKFLDKSPIKINGVEMEMNSEGQMAIMNYLKSGAPDMSDYDYQPLTDEQRAQVHRYISALDPNASAPMVETLVEPTGQVPVSNSSDLDSELNSVMNETTKSTDDVPETLDDVDDILNNLDLD